MNYPKAYLNVGLEKEYNMKTICLIVAVIVSFVVGIQVGVQKEVHSHAAYIMSLNLGGR